MSSRHLHSSLVMLSMLGLSSALSLSNPALAEESLGVIQVESTTIDDRFENKRNEASNIGVISGEEVDKDHPENIQKMLQRIPGITTEVQSGDSLKIHIRGIENQVYMGERPGVAVVIDGVPVFERTGRVNIDLDNIESVKVIKGGASYLFGDDALAGAVIITTKRGAKYAGAKVETERGSFGYKKWLVRGGFAEENVSGHLQVSHREVDGYYDDSASKTDYVNGKFQYYIDDTSDISVGMEVSDRNKNSHGAVTGVTAAENDPKSEDVFSYNDYANKYDVGLQKVYATYSKDIDESGNLMLNVYEFKDYTNYFSNPVDADPTKYGLTNDYDQIQRGLKSEYRASGEELAWMAGLDVRNNEYREKDLYLDCSDYVWNPACAVGGLAGHNITNEDVDAVYGEVKFRMTDRLIGTTNARYDSIDMEYSDLKNSSNNGDKNFKISSYRLGLNYALKDNSDLYANVSTGFRTPTVQQLFVGNSFPTMAVDPNPDLEPEEAVNFELGLRAKKKIFGIEHDVDVAIFQIDRKDYIQSTAGQYTTGTDNIYDNVGDVRNRGLELSLASDMSRTVSWDLAYTYLDAKYTRYDSFILQTEPVAGACPAGATPVANAWPPFTVTNCLTPYDNTGNTVPRTPEHVINFIVHYRPAEHWLLNAEVENKSSYYVDEINQEEIGGHSVFNLWMNYDRKFGDYDISFFARIDNVFDEFYYNTARAYSDGNEDGVYNEEDISLVVNQGRTYTAGLSVAF